MKHRYLTIEREYGAGGTAIAEKIAELTGIPCFGHEILELASKKAGVSVEEIEQYEESVHSSLFYTLYAMQRAYSGNTEILDKEGQTFVAEQLIIEQQPARHFPGALRFARPGWPGRRHQRFHPLF